MLNFYSHLIQTFLSGIYTIDGIFLSHVCPRCGWVSWITHMCMPQHNDFVAQHRFMFMFWGYVKFVTVQYRQKDLLWHRVPGRWETFNVDVPSKTSLR